jgi:imidazolonepropionase-like amidohydrolase
MRVPLLTLVGILVAAASVSARAAENSEAWLLSGSRILVAPNAIPIDNGVVLIRGGKIVAVGKRSAIRIPAGIPESSCAGGVIAAGFQNSHVHFIGEPFQDAANQAPEALTRRLTESLTRYGFTTVVDTGSDRDNTLALRSRIERGEVRGPRILTVGLPLYPPDGIPFYLAGLPKPLLDKLPQPATPDDAVKEVRANLNAGADGTKLFVAAPQGNWTAKRMPAPIALAAADATHRRGKLVMVHPTDIEGIRAALAAKVDVLVHTTLGDASWPDSLVRQLVAQRVSVAPTLKLWGYELNKEKMPEAVQQSLIAATLTQLKAFSDAGGDVLFGTDVGYMIDSDPTEEYALMAKAGLTPMQILASLTSAPASRWKESRRRGRIVVGMDADLVVLEGDPAVDVRNFAKVRCVFRGGAAIYEK